MESPTPQSEAQIVLHHLAQVRHRIADAAQQCGRRANSIVLLAVSKQQPISAMRAAAAAGQRDFGENYLQDALPKLAELTDLDLIWHFIGQVQSNKTRPIAEQFHWVHTVDRLKIAQRLSEQRPAHLPPLQICVQVKLAEEAGKGGVPPDEVGPLAQAIAELPRLRVRGLMCIPPPSEDYQEQLLGFRRCAELLADVNSRGLKLDTLSMGMSGDLEAAIEAGATIVRVGTAIFGLRQKR